MTTTARTTDPSDTVARRARTATIGATLWTLSAGVWAVSDLEYQQPGSLGFVAVAVAWWICMVLAPALLVVGHSALRAALGPAVGKVGRTGIVVAATGLGAMGLGIGIEVASMTFGGGEVALGHAILLVGFLVAVVGSLVTGIAVLRRRRDGLSRGAGSLLVLALPLGIGIMFLGSAVAPGADAVFWAGLTVPTGLAWLLLGTSLRSEQRPVGTEFASVS
jgi:hypothetical protein